MNNQRRFELLWKITFLIAAVGLVASLIIHLSALTGVFIESFGFLAPVFNVILFPVLLASFYSVIRSDAFEQLKRRGSKKRVKDLFHIMFIPSPLWLRLLIVVFLLYAIANIVIFFVFNEGAAAVEMGNQYLLVDNDDEILKQITSNEYWRIKAKRIRGFSGHWMFFYSVSLTILYAQLHRYSRD